MFQSMTLHGTSILDEMVTKMAKQSIETWHILLVNRLEFDMF